MKPAAILASEFNHVPKNAASLSTQCFFADEQLGWNIGASANYQGARTAQRGTDYVPVIELYMYDVSAGYEAKIGGAKFSVKTCLIKVLFSRNHTKCAIGQWGDPRTPVSA